MDCFIEGLGPFNSAVANQLLLQSYASLIPLRHLHTRILEYINAYNNYLTYSGALVGSQPSGNILRNI